MYFQQYRYLIPTPRSLTVPCKRALILQSFICATCYATGNTSTSAQALIDVNPVQKSTQVGSCELLPGHILKQRTELQFSAQRLFGV